MRGKLRSLKVPPKGKENTFEMNKYIYSVDLGHGINRTSYIICGVHAKVKMWATVQKARKKVKLKVLRNRPFLSRNTINGIQ